MGLGVYYWWHIEGLGWFESARGHEGVRELEVLVGLRLWVGLV